MNNEKKLPKWVEMFLGFFARAIVGLNQVSQSGWKQLTRRIGWAEIGGVAGLLLGAIRYGTAKQRITLATLVILLLGCVIIGQRSSRSSMATSLATSKSEVNTIGRSSGTNLLGVIFWTHHELAKNRHPDEYLQKMKTAGFTAGILKVSDGAKWFGDEQAKPEMVEAFHRNGLKCYLYGTAWLRDEKSVGQQVKNALRAMDNNKADGWVFDDVFVYPSKKPSAKQLRKLTKQLFDGVRGEMKKSPGKYGGRLFCYSTYPHMLTQKMPWDVPLQDCDYFIVQGYLNDFHVDPVSQMVINESNWQGYIAKRKIAKNSCEMIPAVDTYGEVTAEKLGEFLRVAKRSYPAVTVFRVGKIDSPAKWRAISENAGEFARQRTLVDLSIAKQLTNGNKPPS